MPAPCCPLPSIWLVPREGGVLAPAMQLTTQSASDLVPGWCYTSGAAQSFQDYSGKRNTLLCSLRQWMFQHLFFTVVHCSPQYQQEELGHVLAVLQILSHAIPTNSVTEDRSAPQASLLLTLYWHTCTRGGDRQNKLYIGRCYDDQEGERNRGWCKVLLYTLRRGVLVYLLFAHW